LAENTAVTELDPSLTGFVSNTDTITSGLIRVSNQLIEDSAFSIESFLTDLIASRYYRGVAQMVTTGNASNIAGILPSATVGYTLPVGGASTLNYPGLVSIFGALDPAYSTNAVFAVNSTVYASLLDLTDTLGRPLLTADLQGNPFRMLFGKQIITAQALPNLGASAAPLLYGDFSTYTFRQARQMVIKKFSERYAEFNETGYVAFARVGGYLNNTGVAPILSLKQSAT
jgi:HK97 family phage major capsid protein